MNCDCAFDRMTSPDGLTDPALQRHLDVCPRCRQMQETLSPALDWLTSGTAEPWSTSSATTATATPLLTMQAVRVAEEAAHDLSRRRTASQLRRVLSIAAMLICGAALGIAAYDVRRPTEPPVHSVAPGLMTACLWNDPALRSRLPDSSAQSVVASCVVCHIPPSIR